MDSDVATKKEPIRKPPRKQLCLSQFMATSNVTIVISLFVTHIRQCQAIASGRNGPALPLQKIIGAVVWPKELVLKEIVFVFSIEFPSSFAACLVWGW